jgi:hypothetical protein
MEHGEAIVLQNPTSPESEVRMPDLSTIIIFIESLESSIYGGDRRYGARL